MDNKDNKRKPSRINSYNLSSPFLDNYVDHLTKAYNRSFLFHFLPEILNNAQKKDYSVALFIVDLDNFKHINDTYGHLGGDRVLKDVAESLKLPLRENDYLIRYGGDEFLIIHEDVNLKSASTVGKRIIDSVRALKINFKDKIIIQTVSMGFSLFPDDAKDLESLIERADEALYLVKKRDKNEFVYYREVNTSQISLKVGMNSFPCSEFVGRENEISIIKKNIKEVQDVSDISGVMVFGESGVGKTRLLKESACIAQEIGFDQISFIPFQNESLKEYSLLTKSFNLYLMNNIVHNKEKTFEILNCMDSETIKILVYFIPCLKDYFSQLANKPENSLEIFEAFSILMEKIAQQKGGLVLTFDNVHYADLKSLEFCNFILKSNKKSKLFFYINTLDLIPAGIFNPSAIAQFIKRIISNEKIKTINLGFLSKEYTGKMVGTIFPGVGNDLKFCQIVYDITKGQPFFIEELLRYLLEKSVIFFEDNSWKVKDITKDSIPSSVNEVIMQRIEALEPTVKETILMSAAIGQDINLEVLSKAKSLSEGDVLEILDKARKLKFLKDEGDGFSFLNIVSQEATLSKIPDSQRKGICNKASDALMDVYKDNIETVSFQLANLFSKTEDLDKINKFSKIIAEKASNIFNPKDVVKYLKDISEIKNEQKIETVIEEIEEDKIDFVSKFLQFFQSALKYFKLYPRTSKLRKTVVDSIYEFLNKLFVSYSAIDISEVEKSLVINKRRITSRLSRYVDVDGLVNFMIERDIKTIIFLKDISKQEIITFIEIIVSNPNEFLNKGNWEDIALKENMKHIILNKAIYMTPNIKKDGYPMKDKVESAMISDFILGKISGKDLKNINIVSVLNENPQALTDEILKTAEKAKQLNKNSDKLDILLQGMKKVRNVFQEDSVNREDIAGEKANKQMIEVFKGFDAKTKTRLIIKSESSDEAMVEIVKTLGNNNLENIIDESFVAGGSLWSMNKLILKLQEAHNYSIDTVKNNLIKNLSAKLDCKEEEKFIVNEMQWDELPIESKMKDMVKMEECDLEEMSSNQIIAIIKEVIVSENYNKFQELFISLRSKVQECDSELSEKIEKIFISVFENVYSNVSQQSRVFVCLAEIISSILKVLTKANFEFTIRLISLISSNLKLNQIEIKDAPSKIEFFYSLKKCLENCEKILGIEEVRIWEEKIDFKKLSIDLFYLKRKGLIIGRNNSELKSKFYYMLCISLGKITEVLAQELTKLSDPFEKFVFFNKFQDFFSTLESEKIQEAAIKMIELFMFDDICELLSYTNKDNLAKALENIYHKLSFKQKKIIIDIINKNELKEALSFMEKLKQEENALEFKNLIENVYNKLKR